MTLPHPPTPQELALGAWLTEHLAEPSLAWIPHGETLFFARPGASPAPVWSPTLQLIQALRDRYPDPAHPVLRSRIFTTTPITLLERQFVHLTAKKIRSLDLRGAPPPRDPQVNLIDLTEEAAALRARTAAWHDERESALPAGGTPWEAAEWWSAQGSQVEERYRSDRAIGALLQLPDGTRLGAANLAGENRSLHAEVNLVQRWWAREGRPIPADAQVFVTQQSCRMCAAILVTACAAPETLRVYYRDPDPGRFARSTELQRLDLEAPDPQKERG